MWACACDYRCEACGADARYPQHGCTLITQNPVIHICWECYDTGRVHEVLPKRREGADGK